VYSRTRGSFEVNAPFLEDRIVKKIGSRHRHFHIVIIERLFEFAHNAIAFLRSRVDRNQVVVVKIDTVSAEPA
jgi:hypothetical protein